MTVTDEHGHAAFHGCARPGPKTARNPGTRSAARHPGRARDGPGFSFTRDHRDGPPGGLWRLAAAHPRPPYVVDAPPPHHQGLRPPVRRPGHEPGVKLRHLAQVRHATCTSPVCRRPASQCDFEHNIPYEAGGRTCLCNGGPKCRHDHRLKQDPRWKVDQLPDGTFRWTTPSGTRVHHRTDQVPGIADHRTPRLLRPLKTVQYLGRRHDGRRATMSHGVQRFDVRIVDDPRGHALSWCPLTPMRSGA